MLVYPKINLSLEIVERRADGFHNLATIMHIVDNIADELTIAPAADLSLTCATASMPLDATNLILRAARALQTAAGIKRGARFHLQKNIPIGGGLGGGSADAAAALKLCNELWALNWSPEKLAKIAETLGSDVAFFSFFGDGGTALCEGRGEMITPLKIAPLPITLIIPPWSIATATAYRALNPATFNQHPLDDFLTLLKNPDRTPAANTAIMQGSFNVFEAAVYRLEPRQAALAAALQSWKIPGRLSGSGACMWTLRLDEPAKNNLRKKLPPNFLIV